MGLCQGNMGDFAGASENLAKAKELAARINEPLTLAESDSNLGILYWERGDYPQALQLLNNSLETERKNTLRRNEGVDLNNLGLVKKSMGYFPDAMRAFEDALAIAREVGNVKDEAIALSNRALLNRITGKLSEARADYRAALELYERTGFQEGKAGALLGVGKIAEREDRDLETALNCYREALDIYSQLRLPRNQAEALLQIGGVLKPKPLQKPKKPISPPSCLRNRSVPKKCSGRLIRGWGSALFKKGSLRKPLSTIRSPSIL